MSVRTRIDKVEVIYAPWTYEVNLAGTIDRSFIQCLFLISTVIVSWKLSYITARPLRDSQGCHSGAGVNCDTSATESGERSCGLASHLGIVEGLTGMRP
jgi:hypothetical protein